MIRSLFLDPANQLRSGWKVAIFLIALRMADQALVWLAPWLPYPDVHAEPLHIHYLLFIACLLVTALFLRAEDQPLASVGLRLDRRWGRQWLAGILAGAAIMLVTALLAWLGGGFRLVRVPAVGPAQLLSGAVVFLGVALAEELQFRGYLFQRLIEGLGPWGAQLLLAILFALDHWGNPGMTGATRAWASLNIGLAGILLGLCYLRTRSLALPIGLHLGWNWTQGCLLGFGVSGTDVQGWWTPRFLGRPDWVTGGRFGLEAGLPCTLVCAVALLLLSRYKPLWPSD